MIAINTGYTWDYVNKRVRKLSEAGLLERIDEGYYEITDDGQAYLDSKLNVDVLENDNDYVFNEIMVECWGCAPFRSS